MPNPPTVPSVTPGGDEATIPREMDTNFYGPLHMARAIAPALGANGRGRNPQRHLGSVVVHPPGGRRTPRRRPRAWALADSTPLELAAQGTHVVAVHMGLVDTDMASGWTHPRSHRRTSQTRASTPSSPVGRRSTMASVNVFEVRAEGGRLRSGASGPSLTAHRRASSPEWLPVCPGPGQRRATTGE